MLGRVSLLLLSCLWLLPGCSGGSYELQLEISIAPDVEIPEGSIVVARVWEDEDSPALRLSDGGSEPASPGQRMYTIFGEACCAPDPVLGFLAFLDLDADGEQGADEPAGEDPDSPRILANPRRTTVVHIEVGPPEP